MSLNHEASRSTKSRRKTGLPPGTLIHRGDKKTAKSQLDLVQYNEEDLIFESASSIGRATKKLKEGYRHWINMDGLHNIDMLRKLGDYYGLSSLLLEDILNTDQRPKLDVYKECIFFPMKILYLDENKEMSSEQISLVLGDEILLSFREKESDHFDQLVQRMQSTSSRVRQKQEDYLFYRMIDTVVDHYFEVMDDLSEDIEALEEEVYFSPSPETIQKIQSTKKELINFRRNLYPMREAVMKILRLDHHTINPNNLPFFNDVNDHLHQLIESYESNRDLLSNLLDMYMTLISNRMNEVMKVLTIISTIFIPLSFIAGVYGMNFIFMPELNWKYGYFVVVGMMFMVVVLMLRYFRKKKWI